MTREGVVLTGNGNTCFTLLIGCVEDQGNAIGCILFAAEFLCGFFGKLLNISFKMQSKIIQTKRFVRKSKSGIEIWAYLPHSTSKSKCLLMYTNNGGESWKELIEYRKSSHKIWLASSSNEPVDELYFYIEDRKNHERVVYKVNDL